MFLATFISIAYCISRDSFDLDLGINKKDGTVDYNESKLQKYFYNILFT